jgi:heme/copper-type cytochrome/quinol oxidase subunit 1
MRFTDRLSMAQRIVVVVALGFAFGVIGKYLDSLDHTGLTGWYAYAPLSRSIEPPGAGLAGWLRLLVWFVLIGLWAVAAARVLRPAPAEPPAAGQP